MSESRSVSKSRKTKETDIQVRLNLDGSGQYEINTGIPFFDHMLAQLARHGQMDLTIRGERRSGDRRASHGGRCGLGSWPGAVRSARRSARNHAIRTCLCSAG